MSADSPTANGAAVREAARRGAELLGVEFPLIQAGMGGIAVPALAAAVSGAGALGTVALYKSSGEQTAALVAGAAALTACTFGVNVIPEVADRVLGEQIDALLAHADRRLTVNSYGLPPSAAADAVLDAGHRLVIQIGTARDAKRAVELGAHALVFQGTQAGGHHLGPHPLEDLLRLRGFGVPVFAAGAVTTGEDLAGVIGQGACGALCGTLFVAAAESAAHQAYKEAVVQAGEDDTVVTERFSIGWPGRAHRVLRGPVTDPAEPPAATLIAWTTVMGARRPVPRGSAAAPTVEAEGRIAEMARYAGLGCARITGVEPAAGIVARLRAQFDQALLAAAA